GVLGTANNVSLTLKIKFGNIVIGTTGLRTLLNGLSNRGWQISNDFVVFSTGVTGAVDSQGLVLLPLSGLTIGDVAMVKISNPSTISVNTTIANALQLSATWSSANANNTITLRSFNIETMS